MKTLAIGFLILLLFEFTAGMVARAAAPSTPFDAGSRGFYRVVNLAPGEPLKTRTVSRNAPMREARDDFPNGTLVFATGSTFNGQKAKWYEVIVGGAYASRWTSTKHFYGWLPAGNLQKQKILTFPGTTLPRAAACSGISATTELKWSFEWDDRQWKFVVEDSDVSGTGKPVYSRILPSILLFQNKQREVSVMATLAFQGYASNPMGAGEYNASASVIERDGWLSTLDSGTCAAHPKVIVPAD